jgi:hypothetical protein
MEGSRNFAPLFYLTVISLLVPFSQTDWDGANNIIKIIQLHLIIEVESIEIHT